MVFEQDSSNCPDSGAIAYGDGATRVLAARRAVCFYAPGGGTVATSPIIAWAC
jgi:hypothetical protein